MTAGTVRGWVGFSVGSLLVFKFSINYVSSKLFFWSHTPAKGHLYDMLKHSNTAAGDLYFPLTNVLFKFKIISMGSVDREDSTMCSSMLNWGCNTILCRRGKKGRGVVPKIVKRSDRIAAWRGLLVPIYLLVSEKLCTGWIDSAIPPCGF